MISGEAIYRPRYICWFHRLKRIDGLIRPSKEFWPNNSFPSTCKLCFTGTAILACAYVHAACNTRLGHGGKFFFLFSYSLAYIYFLHFFPVLILLLYQFFLPFRTSFYSLFIILSFILHLYS